MITDYGPWSPVCSDSARETGSAECGAAAAVTPAGRVVQIRCRRSGDHHQRLNRHALEAHLRLHVQVNSGMLEASSQNSMSSHLFWPPILKRVSGPFFRVTRSLRRLSVAQSRKPPVSGQCGRGGLRGHAEGEPAGTKPEQAPSVHSPVNGFCAMSRTQRDSITPTGDLTDMATSRDTLGALTGTLVGHFRTVISVGEKLAVPSLGVLGVLVAVTCMFSQTAGVLVLEHANVLDGASDQVLKDVTIVLDKGRIVSIGKTASVPGGSTVLNVNGRWVLPGYIDAHTHIDTYENARRAIATGVTTTRTMSSLHFTDVGLRELHRQGLVDIPEFLASGYQIRPDMFPEFFLDFPHLAALMKNDRGPKTSGKSFGQISAAVPTTSRY